MGSIPSDGKETIFRSKLPDIPIPDHLPVHSYVFERLDEVSSRPCLIDGATGEVLTYSEVHLLARRVASGLRALGGVGRSDVIMILLQNSIEFALSFLGASFLGATSTTANPFYKPAEIHKQAAAAGVKLVVTESCNVGKVVDLLGEGGVKVVVIDEPVPEGCIRFSDLAADVSSRGTVEEADVHPDDVVALPYSSGTTGLPKGVMLTHRGQVTSVAQQVDGENPNLYFRKEDVILCVAPLFHIYSLNSVLLCGLRVGAAIVLMRRFEIEKAMELVERHGVTIEPLVPTIVVEMAKRREVVERYDISTVRMVMSGAAPLGKELEEKVREMIPTAKLGQVNYSIICFFTFGHLDLTMHD